MRLFLAVFGVALISSQHARADCNVAKLLQGPSRIENIRHKGGWETGIVFGNHSSNSHKLLGYIEGPERDDSRLVRNTDGEWCFRIQNNLSLSFESDCQTCPKLSVTLRKSPKGYPIVQSDGTVLGTIEGKLPD